MSHDEGDPTLRMRTLLQYKFDQIRPKPQLRASDDLMEQSIKWRSAKEAVAGIKDYAGEHRLAVGLVGLLFTVLTLGGFRFWRR